MIRLEEIKRGSRLGGLNPERIAEVVQVARFGADALNLIFRVNGRVGERLVYRGEETAFERIEAGRGYVPQLDTYIGPETPNPLFITLLRSKHEMPAMEIVLKDNLGLAKINYNSCNYNDSLLVTVRFAKMVGEVLTMGSAKGSEKQPFKFYV
jgi:hypothetical protein